MEFAILVLWIVSGVLGAFLCHRGLLNESTYKQEMGITWFDLFTILFMFCLGLVGLGVMLIVEYGGKPVPFLRPRRKKP
jgi:hypothetical protein